MSEAIPEDVEKLLARLHATAEELANIEHFEGWVPGCDYEPIFKGSTDLLDARDKIAALMAERTRQEERVRVLEEALRLVKSMRAVDALAPPVHEFERAKRNEAWAKIDEEIRATLGNGGGDA